MVNCVDMLAQLDWVTDSVKVSSNGTATGVPWQQLVHHLQVRTLVLVSLYQFAGKILTVLSWGVPGVKDRGLSASTYHRTMYPSLSSTNNKRGPLTFVTFPGIHFLALRKSLIQTLSFTANGSTLTVVFWPSIFFVNVV